MYSRLLKPPRNKSFFLFGPRGTGKTTWVKNTFPRAVYIDLLEAEKFNDLLADPQRLGDFIPRAFRDWIVIDEVQRVPDLLHEIHRLIEKERYRFVLTGSSARKLRRAGPNLLAGRALTYFMHPLTSTELGSDFKLDRSLQYGNLPSVYVEAEPRKYLESYVRTYLENEVMQEGLTRNLGAFSRFLEAASFSQAGVLNVTEIARECAVERKVVTNYFGILEDLLLAQRLPVFTRRSRRRLIGHPKFFFFDTGIYRVLRPAGPLDRSEEIEGAAWESLLYQEIRALNDALDLGFKMYFWRTSSQSEVDLVLYGRRGLYVFEVKRTKRLSRSMFAGLKSFLADYPVARPVLVYGGRDYQREGKIEIYPFPDFLKKLPSFLA